MKQMIEYLEVWMESQNQRSMRQLKSGREIAGIVTDPDFHGSTTLLNIRSLPAVKAFLLLIKGEPEKILGNGNPAGIPYLDPAQLLVLPLNINGHFAPGLHADANRPPAPAPAKTAKKQRRARSVPSDNGDVMTAPQRRYLFRLLAEKKQLKGKEAEEYLKEQCEVLTLEEINKRTASQFIDELLNGGDDHD